MSVPEPNPKLAGFPVTVNLIQYLQEVIGPSSGSVQDLVKERNEFGMQKYGQPLMSEDGRNGLEDARQELGDLLQYVYKVFGPEATEQHSVNELRKFKELWTNTKEIIDQLL